MFKTKNLGFWSYFSCSEFGFISCGFNVVLFNWWWLLYLQGAGKWFTLGSWHPTNTPKAWKGKS